MIIGRKSDADIQLCTDATISRHHSIIEYVQKNPNLDGRFYLQDNGSKFGTVVLLNARNPLCVDSKLHGVQFQVGGDLIRINYKTVNFFHNLTTNEDEIDFNNM
jgi:pSer/pThr/pTyr-binding forkhead associated (FHA) protein